MLSLIIIFIISIIGISWLLGREISAIRKGAVVIDEETPDQKGALEGFSVSKLKADIEYVVRIQGHRFVLKALKKWIIFSFWIKEQKEKYLPKKETIDADKKETSLSKFVSTLSEYKDHLKHVAKKVKEREERKRE
jgi:hypothetical protein